MFRPVKKPSPLSLVIVYSRIRRDDHEEMQRREKATGATIAAQIRILVHEGLQGRTVK